MIKMDELSNDFKLQFKTICKIIQSYDEGYSYLDNKEFNELKDFITFDFLKFIENEPLVNKTELVNKFEKELDKFYMYAACSHLVKKTLVGVGGALNSGKSSFLNNLFSINILPSMITPSTSVPTYLIKGEKVKISLLNIFNKIINVNEEEMKNIYYEFEDTYNIPVSDIIKNVFIQVPQQKYLNLSFLDIVGYSFFGKEAYNDNNDYKIIGERLNSCDYILWFVDSECGTIKQSDIDFLENLKKDIPILIVISRADKKQISDIEKIENEVRMKLKKSGIGALDIIPYSSKNSDIYSINKIEEYLEKWNMNDVKCTIARDFQVLFDKFGEHFYEERKKEKMNLSIINSLLINAEQIEEIKKIELIQEEIRYKINRIKQKEKELKKLNIKFFSLLKKSAEAVGIDIYESLTDEQNGKIANFIKEYKKENKIKDKNYKNLINIRLYYSSNESFINSRLFSSRNSSIIYKDIINKKLNNINRKEQLQHRKSIKKIIESFSELSFKLEKKEKNNNMLIRNKVKNLKVKDIDWIKIKEV